MLNIIRKVWIFGDRPDFISDDKIYNRIYFSRSHGEHAWDKAAGQKHLSLNVHVCQLFGIYRLSICCSSDDFFLLKDYSIESACKDRYVENLTVGWPRPAWARVMEGSSLADA